MHIFYTPDIGQSDSYTLSEEESKHCIRVLRLKKDDPVQLIDGCGNLYLCRIDNPDQRKCMVAVEKVTTGYNKRNFHLHIAIAPTKSTDRFEWFLEKAVEIGVDEITPLLCTRSERSAVKPERLEKVVVAAMKQSVVAKKPVLNKMTKYDDFIRLPFTGTIKFIAHCAEGQRATIGEHYLKGENAVILIGPEGDFTKAEIDIAIQHRYLPVTLGNNRLRTETAGVVACAQLNFLNE
ncbi:MAG: 16S rRNA (uracil(1498)-N(3))-methyltransferase [Bacteroidales bacterium]|nr:16S rRNA (uracil(1498)-N(3))-methyltransferase [Bacteroidales bacterium]